MRIFSIFHFELSNRFVTEWTILGIPKNVTNFETFHQA